MRSFKRDKRSPIPSSETSSRILSSIRSKNTKPEIIVRKWFWVNGLRGYRLHYKIPGRPDIAFPKAKVAIFIHGCFWHRCPKCNLALPKSNSEFWKEKFDRNVERDNKKLDELSKIGWQTFVIWECQLNTGDFNKIKDIHRFLKNVGK